MKCFQEQAGFQDLMHKTIDYKKVDMSEAEFTYYKELIKEFSDDTLNGENYFRELFDTDDNGLITIVKVEKSIPWAILFFIQQVQINQRLRLFDKYTETLEDIKKRVEKLEKDTLKDLKR